MSIKARGDGCGRICRLTGEERRGPLGDRAPYSLTTVLWSPAFEIKGLRGPLGSGDRFHGLLVQRTA
jgi:hypothetical protein